MVCLHRFGQDIGKPQELVQYSRDQASRRPNYSRPGGTVVESCLERVINEDCDHQSHGQPYVTWPALGKSLGGRSPMKEILVLLFSSLLWEPPFARFDQGPEAGEPSIEPIQIDLPG